MKTSSTSSSVRAAWWLGDGDEECPHCGRLYFYEVEFRCMECDGPGCPHCTVTHTEGHLVCVECAPTKISNKGRRRG